MIRNAIIKRTEGFECCVKLIRNEQRSRLSERKPNLTSTPLRVIFNFPSQYAQAERDAGANN